MNFGSSIKLSEYKVTVPYVCDQRLLIDFSLTRFQRENHPDAKVEQEIDAIWVARKIENSTLFNAGKFRFSHATLLEDQVTLHLGLTDYKTYIGTHARDNALVHLTRRCMAQPLGNATVVQTTDGYFPVIVRSATAADLPGGVALPGGHAEPDEVHPPLAERDARIEQILAQGARAEVVEEIFADQDDVPLAEDFVFLGLVERLVDEKSTMIYFTNISITADQLTRKYQDRNLGKSESTNLFLLAADELSGLRNFKKFSPVAELLGALDLWEAMSANVNETRTLENTVHCRE